MITVCCVKAFAFGTQRSRFRIPPSRSKTVKQFGGYTKFDEKHENPILTVSKTFGLCYSVLAEMRTEMKNQKTIKSVEEPFTARYSGVCSHTWQPLGALSFLGDC